MGIKEDVMKMKLLAPKLAATTNEERNAALDAIAAALKANTDKIFAANHTDMENADTNGVTPAVKKRLKFDEGKLNACLEGLEQLKGLEDPLGKTLLKRELDEGLVLQKITCPIGVIGVIFEARPDALVQIASLCIKSGNCAILKGGKETAESNRVLFTIIRDAVTQAGLPEGILLQAEAHSEIDELLSCEGYVDLIIPRGSNAFVSYIMEHTRIPVMGHADGVCHIYVDKAYDEKKLVPIVLDAKLQYTAACNAVETLLVDRSVADKVIPALEKAFAENGIKVRGTAEVTKLLKAEEMGEDEFHKEYLEPVVSVKLVSGVEEAVDHINRFGSHHTDSILTEDEETAGYFQNMVDSAGVYWNCSTRFSDGFRYGFGAEVGISTSKLHARGPVGLDGLVTYKYKLFGHGQIVGDYAEGKKSFKYRDLM